ncbi:MAG: hypothetical protein QM820_09500 [Minicystis sp.]
MSAKVEHDEAFRATVEAICGLYTRQLRRDERVFSLDEKTSLQPRPRKAPTMPALPGNQPRHARPAAEQVDEEGPPRGVVPDVDRDLGIEVLEVIGHRSVCPVHRPERADDGEADSGLVDGPHVLLDHCGEDGRIGEPVEGVEEQNHVGKSSPDCGAELGEERGLVLDGAVDRLLGGDQERLVTNDLVIGV